MRAFVLVGAAAICGPSRVAAQAVLDTSVAQYTLEAYGNLSAGALDSEYRGDASVVGFDGGIRILGRTRLNEGPGFGLRLSSEINDDSVRLTEASLLLFGGAGRLEIGERMGLPDVLTGYAPNNFQFTSAEFGPASGPSLDPSGRLQTAFLPAGLAEQVGALVSLGVTASLFEDQSAKVLYVSPKTRGWLAGVSYADDADDSTIGGLFQAGITHESYWRQNVLRWGATYAHGRTTDTRAATRDLDSAGAGISLTIDDSLVFGIAASRDGRSRLSRVSHGDLASDAWGATASVNYNTGPWTVGAYYQVATSEGDDSTIADDRLAAFELGASWRFTTKLRLYGAWYRFDFEDDAQVAEASAAGNVFILGMRATL